MPRRISQRARWVRTSAKTILENTPDGWTSSTAAWSGGNSQVPALWVGTDDPYGFRGPTYGEKLAAVGRARGLIANTLASVPWHVYRGVDQLPTPRWIWDPQKAQLDGRSFPGDKPPVWLTLTGVQFWSAIVMDMLDHGEATILYDQDQGLDASVLYPVHAADVEDVDPTRGVKIDGTWTADTRWGVLRLLGQAPYRTADSGGYRGVGVLTRYAETLGLAAQVDNYASGTFQSGVPSGYLKATQPGLSPEDAEALASRWMDKHGSRRQVAVLGNTVDWVPVSMSPVDAELVKMQDFTLRQIAHAYGMSAHYLDVAGSSDTYANVRDRALDFRQLTLLPWARLIESELSTRLPTGTTVRLELDGLERGTTGQRYADYATALASGWLTKDEVRQLEHMPPLPTQSDENPVPASTQSNGGTDA